MWSKVCSVNFVFAAIVCVSIIMFVYRSHVRVIDDVQNLREIVSQLKDDREREKMKEHNPSDEDPTEEEIQEDLIEEEVEDKEPTCTAFAISDEESEIDEDVTSEEIEEIMTNLRFGMNDNVSDVDSDAVPEIENDFIIIPNDAADDVMKFTDEQLNLLKYDDLRKFLRSQSISMKGTKKDLIDRIKQVSVTTDAHPVHSDTGTS